MIRLTEETPIGIREAAAKWGEGPKSTLTRFSTGRGVNASNLLSEIDTVLSGGKVTKTDKTKVDALRTYVVDHLKVEKARRVVAKTALMAARAGLTRVEVNSEITRAYDEVEEARRRASMTKTKVAA